MHLIALHDSAGSGKPLGVSGSSLSLSLLERERLPLGFNF